MDQTQSCSPKFREMEAWLAHLETEMDKDPMNHTRYHQSDTMEAAAVFDEDDVAAAVGGGEFAYPADISGESNTPSPCQQLEFDYTTLLHLHHFSDHFDPTSHVLANTHSTIHNNHVQEENPQPVGVLGQWESNRNNNPLQLGARSGVGPDHHQESVAVVVGDDQTNKTSKVTDHDDENDKQQQEGSGSGASSSTKRKRQPSQVQDHIIAERKRRELLSRQFISLSAIIPGLKKTDKTSVLVEAIKHMKELQEKVKALEEVAANRTVESVVVVKKSQIVVVDDGGVDDNDTSSSVDDGCTGSRSSGGRSQSLPEIEVKVSDKSMLIRVYCQKQRGILAKLFQELEMVDLNVINCSVIPFATLALDITILAQVEKELKVNVKDLVRNLGSVVNSPIG